MTATEALDTFEARCAGPIVYGVSDCALLAADVLLAFTGRDPMARWRGRYRTMRGVIRVIRKDGYHDLPDALAAAADGCGWQRIEPGEARSMDLVLAQWKGVVAPALVKDCFAVMRTDGGWAAVPLAQAVAAWRVAGRN